MVQQIDRYCWWWLNVNRTYTGRKNSLDKHPAKHWCKCSPIEKWDKCCRQKNGVGLVGKRKNGRWKWKRGSHPVRKLEISHLVMAHKLVNRPLRGTNANTENNILSAIGISFCCLPLRTQKENKIDRLSHGRRTLNLFYIANEMFVRKKVASHFAVADCESLANGHSASIAERIQKSKLTMSFVSAFDFPILFSYISVLVRGLSK